MSSARGTRSRSQLASPFNHRASVRSFSSAPRVRRPDQQLELSPKSKNKRSLYDRIKDRVTGREYQRGREANIHREELDAIRQRRLTLSGDYKEAKTWEGLAFEGADRPSRQTRAFTGLYPPARKVTNQAKLEAELYRSVIEIARNQAWLRMRSQQKVAAKEARINRKHQGNLLLEGLQHLFTPTITTAQNSQASDHSSQSLVEEIASEVPTGALADPEAAVSFDHSIEKAVDDAIKYILTEDVENESDGKRPLESLQILSQHYFRGELPTRRLVDAAKRVRIEAPERFEILKDLYHKTGHSIPDASLASITSFEALRRAFLKPPPAPTVASALQQHTDLPLIPNVQVWDRRVTSIDNETQLGRWKVMRRVLEERNLPVTGWIEREKQVIEEMEAGRRVGEGTYEEQQARRMARFEGTDRNLLRRKARLQRMDEASKRTKVRL